MILRGSAYTPYAFGAALVAHGESLLVGAPTRDYDGEPSTPAPDAFLFERRGGAWSRIARFVAPDPGLAEGFAHALALDDRRVAVGAPGFENGDGAVTMFDLGGAVQREVDSPDRNVELFDQYGSAVALDGSSIVIGARIAGRDNAGVVYVFGGDGGVVQTLRGPHPREGFGSSIAISGDVMVVGAPAGLAGACYVFRRDASGWREHVRIEGRRAGEEFGASVAITGRTVAVGAPGRFDLGHAVGRVDVYRLGDAGGDHVRSIEDAASFGAALAIAGDRLAIGQPMIARGSEPQVGRVGIYRLDGGDARWLEHDKPSAYARFGTAVAFGSDFIAAGAPGRGTGEVLIAPVS